MSHNFDYQMDSGQIVTRNELASLAKKARKSKGITQTEAAQLLGTTQPVIAMAENRPDRSYLSVRIKMIHAFTDYRIEGPFFRVISESTSEEKPQT